MVQQTKTIKKPLKSYVSLIIEELPPENLEEARAYISNFPFVVLNALYDEKLQLAGINVPWGKSSKKILNELRGKSVNRRFNYCNPASHSYIKKLQKLLLDISRYDMEYYKERNYKANLIETKNDKKVTENDTDVNDLAKMMDKCDMCWKPLEEKNKVLGHIVDMQKGGCKIAIIEKSNRPVVFNRYYFLKGFDGKKELFWDTIEGGNMSRSALDEWRTDKVLDRFMLSLFTAVSVGRENGCVRVYGPEQEVSDFFDILLGFISDYGIYYPFVREAGKKIGISPDSHESNQPYFHNLRRSRDKFPYLPLDYTYSLEEILEKERKLNKKLDDFKTGKQGTKTEEKLRLCEENLELLKDWKKFGIS